MKYAITGPRGAIFNIVEVEPTDVPHYSEISDADAATVQASEDMFFIIDGVLLTQEESIQKMRRSFVNEKIDNSADLDAGKEILRDHFAETRYDFEVAGIVWNGIDVRTDRFTVERIYQARFLAKEDAAFTTDWKLGNGTFLTIDAPTIIGLSDAVTEHLKEAFTKEKVVNGSIDAATPVEEVKAVQW
jgi:hypothetical protein